ncbi:MAG: InlB B-repeat-containing protein [Clostridia bacterium]|nr:InlB B-repeat-containing protein [Clostridia bacterium]
MKKVNKKLLALLMSATLVTAGVGAFVAFNGVNEGTSVTASAAEITTDFTETATLDGGFGGTGDYADAGLYRIWMNSGAQNWSNKCANESAQSYLLEYITINGKTIKEYRDEYAALIASGAASTITWETKMQPNIANDVNNGNATYAPIFVNFTSHVDQTGAILGDSIDMYIPTSFIAPADVTEVGVKAGLELNGCGFSKDVTWTSWGARKQSDRTIISTTVTGVDGSYGASDKFLSFYVSESDYDGLNTVNYKNMVNDSTYLDTYNFYDYIEFDGKSFRELSTKHSQGEQFFNVWSRANSFSTRWPATLKDGGVSVMDAVQEITVKKGCQFPSYSDPTGTAYEVSEDVTFVRMPDGTFVNEATLIKAEEITMSNATVGGEAGELFVFEITCEKWDFTRASGHDYNYFGAGLQAMRKNIYVNGKSLFDINTTVDDSAYVYSTSPMTNDALEPSGTGYQLFQNPTMLYAEKGGHTLRVHVHKDYIGDANEIVVKVARGYKNDGAAIAVGEDVTATVWKKPINVTIDGVAQEGLVYGDKVAKPEDPTKEEAGYTCTFDNWYVAGTDTVYDFETVLEEDVAIESRFTKVANEYTYTFVINPMDRMGGTQFVTAKYGEALVVEAPTAVGKEFLGWVDVEGNAVTLPETMPVDGGTVFASWKITAYELKIVNGDSEKVITFGVEADPDNGVEAAITDNDSLAFMLAGELPEEDDSYTYAWAEALPETFELKNYTFTVVATPKFVEVELGLGETTVEIPAGKFAVSYVPMGEYTVSWTGDATVTLGGAPVESGSVVTVTPRGGNVVITPNGEEACTVVFTVAIYEEPVTELVVGENAINVTVVNNYCAGTEVEFTAVEAGKYVLKVAEGEENADVTLIEEYGSTWIEEMPYEFELEAGATIKFVIATSNVMLTEDEINLVLEKVEEPAFVEVELDLGETTVEIPAGKYAVSTVYAMGEYKASWTGDVTVTVNGEVVENGSVVAINPRGVDVVITPNGDEAFTVVFTIEAYVEPVTQLVVGENAINVTVENYYCAGTEVEFTAVEAGKYVLKVAEGEENADVTLIEEYDATWIEEMPYEFELEAGATIKFVIATSAYMTLTEDEINLVLEKVEEVVPPTSEEPVVPGDSEEPVVPGDSEEPVDPSEPEEEGKKKKKGCGSSLGLGMAGALTAVGAALVIKKRKED